MKKVDRIYLIDDDSIANFVNRYLITKLSLTEELVVLHSTTSAKTAMRTLIEQADEQIEEYVILLNSKMKCIEDLLPSDVFSKLPEIDSDSLFLILVLNNKLDDPALRFHFVDILHKPITRDILCTAWEKISD